MAKNKIFPVFIPNGGCRRRCVFCDQHTISGVSRLPSAAELAALIPEDLDPDTELAFYGGTFTALREEERLAYLRFAHDLKERGRVKAIRLSTHPSYIDEGIASELLSYGVDLVELGIESLDDEVLEAAGRGCDEETVYRAVDALRRAGLPWGAQLMIGLPGDSREKDIASVLKLLPLKPRLARIYPTLVLKGTMLETMVREGSYRPLSLKEAVAVTASMYALFRRARIPVIRMGLQPTAEIRFGSDELVAGPFHPGFGHLVRCRLKLCQMEALLENHDGESLRIAAPKADLPLLFGDGGGNIAALREKREISIGEGKLPAGTIALTPAEKKKHDVFLDVLSEEDFLTYYTKKDRSDFCI